MLKMITVGATVEQNFVYMRWSLRTNNYKVLLKCVGGMCISAWL